MASVDLSGCSPSDPNFFDCVASAVPKLSGAPTSTISCADAQLNLARAQKRLDTAQQQLERHQRLANPASASGAGLLQASQGFVSSAQLYVERAGQTVAERC